MASKRDSEPGIRRAQRVLLFDWEDTKHDTARQLAVKFVDRFPDIIEKGEGIDWNYVGWYVQMLGLAEQGAFPIAYSDYYEQPDHRFLPTTGGNSVSLPMPPGGDARNDEI